MKQLIILYLAFVISASFDQIQGDFFLVSFFPFSDIKMTLSEYLSWIAKFSGFSIVMWVTAMEAKKYRQEFKIAAWLATGFLIDFLLECTHGWFDIGRYAFGYRTMVFIVFGGVILKTILKERLA